VKKFSKVFFTVLIVALLFVGCKTAEKVDIPVAEPVVEAAPVAEPVAEPLNIEIELLGMKFVATRESANQLRIELPKDIAEADMIDFMEICAQASPEYFAPIQYAIGEGFVLLVFPYEFTDEEIIAFAQPIATALEQYVPARVKYYQDLDAQAKKAAAEAAEAARVAAEKAAAEAAEAARVAAEKAAADKAAAEAAAAAAAAKAAQEAAAAAEKAAQEAAAKAAAEKAAAEKAAAEAAASKKSGAGTVILIIVLVLLAAACAYYFLVFRKKGTK
jgi:flagellar biosynthesis GTPase FlhF